ncbi:hypothetical protein GGD83_003725 [Rhodoblastus sphagnicola]|nr:hypothetical protein [Rhodoblastus sphagnicola]
MFISVDLPEPDGPDDFDIFLRIYVEIDGPEHADVILARRIVAAHAAKLD